MQVLWCCGEVDFLEAEVRGSVSYTVKDLERSAFKQLRQVEEAFSVCSPSVFFFFHKLCVCLCGSISNGNCLSLLVLFQVFIVQLGGRMQHCVCDVDTCPVHNHCGVASPLISMPCCCSCARRSALSFFSSSICCLSSSLSISTRSTSL